jgi:hypothetical protein
MPYAKRVDNNQSRIVDVLRSIGCSVSVTSMVGNGFPDIAVGRNGITYLLEIKDGNQPPSKQALTGHEAVWHDSWKGNVSIVNSVETALIAIGAKMQ